MYLLSWWTAYALNQVLFLVFISLAVAQHEDNPLVSA